MIYNLSVLSYLLRIGLETEYKFDFKFSKKPNWKFIFKISSEQGILSIIYDGLDYLSSKRLLESSMLPSRDIMMKWEINILNIENVYDKQYLIGNEFVDILSSSGIKTVVMKGITLAVLYPKPNHRPCGDLDCFLLGDFERGNSIAKKNGADIDFENYKHSHVVYKGLMIENHQFLTGIRGDKRKKNYEINLRKLLSNDTLHTINKTNLLLPDSIFNAIFLTSHSWTHFLNEHICLRHITDWAMLMKHNCNDIDWKRFVEIINIRDTKMINFARCISYIAHYYMGAPMPPIFKDCKQPDELSERVLRYILYDHKTDPCNNPHYWRRKFIILFDRLKGNWKYKAFSDESNIKVAYNLFYDRWCEKHPHL